MVAFMEWVRKNYLLTCTSIVIAVFVGTLAVVEFNGPANSVTRPNNNNGETSHQAAQTELAISCFDTSTATIKVFAQESCPEDLVSLGNSPLIQIRDSESMTSKIHPTLLKRFEAAKLSAQLQGVDLYITSGYRSLSRQERLFREAVTKYGSETEAAKWVLPAPYSHHPQGLALDVNYPGDPIGASWLEKNGAQFGLCRVYSNEWWHFEGVIAPGEVCPALAPNALVDLP
jgi:hypothetical protein